MSLNELRAKYAEFFGEEAWTINNRVWMVKRIAWRMQALAEGDLSERARRRAAELANDADLHLSPPRPARTAPDPVVSHLPPPGRLQTMQNAKELRRRNPVVSRRRETTCPRRLEEKRRHCLILEHPVRQVGGGRTGFGFGG
jgi:hypothetical protein